MSEAEPNLTTADSGPASMMASVPSATDSRGKCRFIYFSCVLSVNYDCMDFAVACCNKYHSKSYQKQHNGRYLLTLVDRKSGCLTKS